MFFACLSGQDSIVGADTGAESIKLTKGAAEEVIEVATVSARFLNKSWFTDRVGTVLIHFETVVEEPATLPSDAAISFISVEIQHTPDSDLGDSVAVVRFVFRETGVVTFPSLEFFAEGRVYRSASQQIFVSAPVRSDAMNLTLKPAKQQVYVGEPLRLDLVWHCDLEAGRLQALNYYPSFFNDASVEVTIPRNTDPEDKQVGLPVGGRRVIGTRTKDGTNTSRLGTIKLPLYLRLETPGKYVLPVTRLECAYLTESSRNFGQYAAHFNNILFSPEDSEVRYQRFYVETEAVEIEVLALPEAGRLAEFSGLFLPTKIDVSVRPTELKLGQLIEAEIKVFSEAPHGMIEFPPLSRQRGLRGRFLVDDDLGTRWRGDGTTFLARVRPLSTSVEAFPSLSIQTFDTESGEYVMLSTNPVPLVVGASGGQNFINLDSYSGARVSLVGQPEGIWHNLDANVMDDLLNKLVNVVATWFWPLLVLGPVVFCVLLPFVRERRRRALDAQYRARIEAFNAFRQLAENDPEKWPAFLQFLAVSFGSGGRAWTVENSRDALHSINVRHEDIEQVVALHTMIDAEEFHPEHPAAELRDLNGIGRRVLDLISKSALLFLFSVMALPTLVEASDWSEAEALFERAKGAPAGSDSTEALYAEAALKFQAVAEAGERPGVAWYNAGNAWFKTGALGRSIAAYREARAYRPFDSLIESNLLAARSLTVNDVSLEAPTWLSWPSLWLKAFLVVVLTLFWVLLLLYIRYRKRLLLILTGLVCLLALCNAALLVLDVRRSESSGVVVVDETFARKGPAYSYAKAFGEPLRDGLEFRLLETRGDWGLISLLDGRRCWVLLNQIQVLSD